MIAIHPSRPSTGWWVRGLEPAPGYVGAAAARGSDWQVRLRSANEPGVGCAAAAAFRVRPQMDRNSAGAWEGSDPVELHGGALDATAATVARLGPHHLSLPTPCRGWDVRRLIEHLIDGNDMFTAAVDGHAPEPRPDDPFEAYVRSTEAVRLAWRTPGVLKREVVLPFGALPGLAAIRMHFVDHLVHGWDLAKATGQDTTIEERLATAAYEEMTGALDASARGPGRPFAPEIPCPLDAPAHERLVAFLGRHPQLPVEGFSAGHVRAGEAAAGE